VRQESGLEGLSHDSCPAAGSSNLGVVSHNAIHTFARASLHLLLTILMQTADATVLPWTRRDLFELYLPTALNIAHLTSLELDFIFRLAQSHVCRARYNEPKPLPNQVTVTRISQEAESRKRRDQIRLDILITLRRALPRDITDIIVKSSIHRMRVAACPDKLVATDPVCSKPQRSYPNRSQRPPRATAPCKHRGR